MRLFLYFSFFILTSSLFAQGSSVLSDEEYQKLQDKARAFINSDVDSAFFYVNKIEKSKNDIHQSFALGLKSYLYQLNGDSIKSRQLYKQAFDLLRKVPAGVQKSKQNAYLLNYGGLAEWKRGNYSKALEYYQQGKKLSENANDLMQVVKFNNNISLINGEVGNYRLAINAAKESDKFTNKIEYLYNEEQFTNAKCNINFNLGNFYKLYYSENRNNRVLLDSAEYYLKKAIVFSKNLEIIKIGAEMNLANTYLLKKDFNSAKKIHHKLLVYTKNKEYIEEYSLTNRNLGELYYVLKEYDKALVYFQKVDSIYEEDNGVNGSDYIYSNYYQAKIWSLKKDYDKALSHSKIYLENFEKQESKLNEEIIGVNYNLSNNDLKKEMNDMQSELKNKGLLKKVGYVFLIVLFVLLVFGLLKNRNDKRKIDKKLNDLIVEYKVNIEKKDELVEETLELQSNIGESENQIKKENTIISIDEEKENEIVEKLKKLENKLSYLNPDFTQQFVAKKIKTNTTYLSYVVNKRFGKSFSEYSNELKINYVINEMISNPTYRKYSTQAIAESVGFKNAVSFTKSFSKRTGVTPVQFAKKLDDTI
ncbi:hypothetical protein FEDK69T_09470 [Flavobacterium enshiense DK69]|uniref:HTH araC/xylS-type domain-containing protein n=1 Tax=Flavobacterium enshiense DK69 TaxID=1107311 RepID=V6SDE2_9FLAO|nr:helix-turn-helix domain-containing protein [Flavobacterium enshiense]ESU24499.1 hypothetical protein FEDK69T_09470 [Flavobacterium enshiense DK69]KGO93845.1 hypothetical protein Q767_14320 [Flavobacterium enshiense DK69]